MPLPLFASPRVSAWTWPWSRRVGRPGLRPLLPGRGIVAGLAIALAGATGTVASAQPGGRSTMITSGDAGTVVVTLFDPDVALLTALDLHPSDLGEIAEILSLSETQAAVVLGYLQRHAADVEGLGFEIPRVGRALGGPPVPPGEDAAPGVDPIDAMVADAMKAAGIDPARLDSDLEMSLGIGVGMSIDSEDPNAEPIPNVQVSLRLGAAPGVSIGAEEKDALAAIAEEIAPKIEAMTRERALEDFRRQREAEAQGAPLNPLEEQSIHGEAVRRVVRAYLADRAAIRRRFDVAAQELLSETQVAAWPAFERWARRRHTLPWGELAMESVDVLEMARAIMDERPDAAEALAAQFAALELDLDAALKRRNEHIKHVEMKIDEACAAGDADEIERLARRSAQRRIAVRDANRRITDAITAAWSGLPPMPVAEDDPWRPAMVLGDGAIEGRAAGVPSADDRAADDASGAVGQVGERDASGAAGDPASAQQSEARNAAMLAAMLGRPASLGDQFHARVRRAGHARVWAVTPAVRAFRAAAEFDLAPEIQAAAAVLEADYRREHATASQRIEAVVARWDADRPGQEVAGVVEALTGEDQRADIARLGPSVAESLERRLEIDRRAIRSLYGLLPAHVVAELPELPEVEELGPVEIRIGDEFGRGGEDGGF
ncbi:MAG: hypothetical protein AB8G96_10430 [Phycisphaerales bacterium]